jgi:methionyl-tRNA formyltransferase
MMKILLWGNSFGVDCYIASMGIKGVVGIVAASNRMEDQSNILAIAEKNKLPVYMQPFKHEKAKYQAFLENISSDGADIFLVIAYSMVLDEIILSYPKLGAFNVHGGLLPQFRGANVLNWVLINGESETGVTIHYIDKNIDTGDIVNQRRIPIDFEDTAVTLRKKLLKLSGEMLSETMPQLIRQINPRIRQDDRFAKYWPARKAEDGFFDWGWPAEKIYNIIRALVNPWPGAFYHDSKGKKVVIDYFISFEEVKKMQVEKIGHIVE